MISTCAISNEWITTKKKDMVSQNILVIPMYKKGNNRGKNVTNASLRARSAKTSEGRIRYEDDGVIQSRVHQELFIGYMGNGNR